MTSGRLLAALNAERRALERRLHDGPQQHLVALAVQLQLVERAVDESPDEARRMLEQLRVDVQDAVAQLRDLASAIYPPLLADRGLADAIRGLGGEVTISGRHDEDVEATVYFACVDAMRGGASSIAVREHDGHLGVAVTGDVDPHARTLVVDRLEAVGVAIAFS